MRHSFSDKNKRKDTIDEMTNSFLPELLNSGKTLVSNIKLTPK